MVMVLKLNNLKFKINQKDHNPPHVHVEGGGASIRINLLTMEVMDKKTEFTEAFMRKIVLYVIRHREELLEKWIEYHGEED